MGTSSSVTSNQQYRDLFLVRTDDRGKELWNETFFGRGKTTGNLLIRGDEGETIVAGSYGGSEPEKSDEIIVLNSDLNGNEQSNRTISTGQPLEIQDIAVAPEEGYFIAGVMADEGNLQKKGLTIIKVLDTPFGKVGTVKNSFDLTIVAKDIKTGTFIGGANVYMDGYAAGSTSEQDGKQTIRGVVRGQHTVRVAKAGFEENTKSVDITEKRQVSIPLNMSKVIPLRIRGSTDEKIDIVFVASKTSFSL